MTNSKLTNAQIDAINLLLNTGVAEQLRGIAAACTAQASARIYTLGNDMDKTNEAYKARNAALKHIGM